MHIAKVPTADMTVITDDCRTVIVDHKTGNHASLTAHGAHNAPKVFMQYCRGLDSDPTFTGKIRKQINDAWS